MFNKEELIPSFSHILLNLTTDCNLRCPYCYFKDYHYDKQRIMSLETCKDILKYCEFLNVKTVHLFGGEPLLNFTPLMDAIGDFAFSHPEVEILMTTNGTLFNQTILSFLEQLPYFTLNFTYLNRSDVNNTNSLINIINNTNINYFITTVINKDNIKYIIDSLMDLPERKTQEYINLQPENPAFTSFDEENVKLFKEYVTPILPKLGIYNLYKKNNNKQHIKDFLQIDSQLKVSPEGNFHLASIYDKPNIGFIGHKKIDPDLLFKYLQNSILYYENDLCINCPLKTNQLSHCYINKPFFYKLLDAPDIFLCGWGQVLYSMINEE